MIYRFVYKPEEELPIGVFVNPASFEPTILCIPGYEDIEVHYKRLPSYATNQGCPSERAAEGYYALSVGYGWTMGGPQEADADSPEALAIQVLKKAGREFTHEQWKEHEQKVIDSEEMQRRREEEFERARNERKLR